MLLSVIIPVYNNPAALERCLGSFCEKQQLLDQVEFIVVDDGSDNPVDNPLSLSTFIGSALSVSVFRIRHQGAACARNEGIRHATGEFVWFFDADDTVDPTSFEALMHHLTGLDEGIQLFHTGAMVTLPNESKPLRRKHCRASETSSANGPLNPKELFVPQTAYLDHTTYIIRRSLLNENETLRYPQRLLLEDSLFVLHLLSSVDKVFVCQELRPYIRHSSDKSLAAGPWTAEKTAMLMPDICYFFGEFRAFLHGNPEIATGEACYRRLRYVYMRMLCVKGCPWEFINSYKQTTGWHGEAAGCGTERSSATFKEMLFFHTPFGRLLATLCRIIR